MIVLRCSQCTTDVPIRSNNRIMTRRTSRQKLSIIMACYNAARTITESVASIYRQKLQIPFEVIIINDASTDESAIRIEALRHRHKEIQVIHSANNRGGGASRNAGIAASTGSLLFCLDADDILPDEMLPRLIAYLGESKLDGVIFEESKFFIRSTRFTISAKNPKLLNGQVLKFSDLFASNAFLTQVNFLYTRQAFDTVGGYPILHGFDTQEFGHRFLAQGLKVSICPGSYYFHRQGMGNHILNESTNGEHSHSIITSFLNQSSIASSLESLKRSFHLIVLRIQISQEKTYKDSCELSMPVPRMKYVATLPHLRLGRITIKNQNVLSSLSLWLVVANCMRKNLPLPSITFCGSWCENRPHSSGTMCSDVSKALRADHLVKLSSTSIWRALLP